MTPLYHILVENLAEIVTIATSGLTIVRYTPQVDAMRNDTADQWIAGRLDQVNIAHRVSTLCAKTYSDTLLSRMVSALSHSATASVALHAWHTRLLTKPPSWLL